MTSFRCAELSLRGYWSLLVLLGGLSAAAVLGGIPARAHASAYEVWACADGSGRMLPASDWKAIRVSSPLGYLQSSCGDAGAAPTTRLSAIATSNSSNQPESAGVGWNVDAPSGTHITGLDVWWVAVIGSFAYSPGRIEIYAPGTIYRLDPPSLEAGARFGGPFAHGPGSQASAFSETNHQTYRNLNSPKVTLMAWCVASCQGQQGAAVTNVSAFEAYRVRLLVEDSAPPTGSVTGLQDGARLAASAALQVNASDVGGGVRELSLRVDGRVVQRVTGDGQCADIDGGSTGPYEYYRMQPCPLQRSVNMTLPLPEIADGARHVVSVVATDAAGQEAVIASARVAQAPTVGLLKGGGLLNPDLDVIGARALNGVNGGTGKAELSFVVRRGKRTRHVPRRVIGINARQRIAGRLTNATGAPITSARVWRAVAIKDGLWQITGRPLITSRSGRVRGWLPARRPSRSVRLVYFPYSDTSQSVQSPARRLSVRAATTMTTSRARARNGDSVRFSGRITSRPMPSGKPVYVQAIVRGRWRTFGTTRASASGRWRFAYRFTATRRRTVYRFRAVIPTERGSVSWATGSSRVVSVVVTP